MTSPCRGSGVGGPAVLRDGVKAGENLGALGIDKIFGAERPLRGARG